jgi:c-di-GMP-binding flagellar brake protein YcgR
MLFKILKTGGRMNRNELFERRKHRRVRVNIPVKCREVLSNEASHNNRPAMQSRCEDLSRGGMKIITEHSLESSSEKLIEAEFTLSGRMVRLIAHVVWCVFDEAIKKHRTGVEFVVIKSTDMEAIGQIA